VTTALATRLAKLLADPYLEAAETGLIARSLVEEAVAHDPMRAPRTCAICGQLFEPARPEQRVCSRSCAAGSAGRTTRPCAECGTRTLRRPGHDLCRSCYGMPARRRA